ncbi:MAG: 50S ribosomal protein L11 methyltransferase, partial [Mogibacterium sp.]|nr:50S ribosomal protein L11 methyltransferase [Mogibacterium sp.]
GMKYKELIIKAKRNESETVQAVLLEAGFDSMQIDDPMDAVDITEHQDLYKYDYINEEISQKANEAETGAGAVVITLYFADDEEGQSRLAEAEKLLSGMLGVSFRTEVTGDDSEWLYKWQEHFKPSKVGERIVVKPGWEDYESAEGELVIEMDPGMAFGSGLHETTSMCIKVLEKDLGGAYDPSRYPIKVLDVGTGTGILAMAAVLLGADEALGIDIDDEAVRVANENIAKNGLEGRISIKRGNLMDGIDYDPDIIVANLMADLVVMLSPAAAAQLRPGGLYITSGILDIKEEIVKKAIEDAGFDIIEVLADGEWRAIAASRR